MTTPPTTPPYDIRPVAADEVDTLGPLLDLAFLESHRPEDQDVFLHQVLEHERALGAFDGDRVVGSAGALTLELTVPGATAPAGGVTIVVVHPAYRRRGVLTAMMRRQLADLHEGGESVAALWASESTIYGRFGYAVGSSRAHVTLHRGETAFVPQAPDTAGLAVELAPPGEARPRMAEVYDAVRPTRPGYITRQERLWTDLLYDPEHMREGATPLQTLLVRDGDRARGYALYNVKPDWEDTLPRGTVRVHEVQALDPAAYAACWRYLASLDLTSTVQSWNQPVDAPLFSLLADPRRARARLLDGLWVRLVRVGEALAQRRYAVPVDMVIEVGDAGCPWNARRWRLSGDETGAKCDPTTDPAEVRLDVRALAACYLGGGVLAPHAALGTAADERPGALRRLSVALAWDPRPWCPQQF